VDRGAKTHTMSFRRGVPGVFDGVGPLGDFTRKSGLHIAGTCPRTRTGTRVRWWADSQVFTKDAASAREGLRERAVQSTFLVPGLLITVIDLRDPEDRYEETFQHKGGITEYVEALSVGEPVSSVIRLHGKGHFRESVPVLDDKGHMTPQDVERELGVDIALRWDTGYESDIRSFVNVIATPKGGTHLTGFERAIVKTVNDQVRAAKILKGAEDTITKDDVFEGLTAVVTVRLAEP
ncbi:MAG: DNA topoisomerase IV subunit B, partial [Actinobacteria bacterium]|nr:DNA topoisomerase IV subunit B [Actinomycetota bacterium]